MSFNLTSPKYISPKHLPNFPTPCDFKTKMFLFSFNNSLTLALAANPLTFSSKSLVRDSGAFIPTNLMRIILCVSKGIYSYKHS